ncbi:Domain of unknown function (DUF1768) [seawater metagenome]|uniref:NADAR domain-containing protein n=1 Tax=seawater metagenome TaxID=1561972 RepID=A0A5E8CJE5_9ZZZZ
MKDRYYPLLQMENYIFFCSHKKNLEGTEIFSQWYPSIFVDDEGVQYHHCEQYMMASKAKIFNDIVTYDLIMKEESPKRAKELGRKVKNFDSDIWNQNAFEIVKKGNLFKFTQNNELTKRLLVTDNKILVEAACYDPIWGIGLNKTQALNTPVSQWPGKNLLGKALTEVRTVIKNNN